MAKKKLKLYWTISDGEYHCHVKERGNLAVTAGSTKSNMIRSMRRMLKWGHDLPDVEFELIRKDD